MNESKQLGSRSEVVVAQIAVHNLPECEWFSAVRFGQVRDLGGSAMVLTI